MLNLLILWCAILDAQPAQRDPEMGGFRALVRPTDPLEARRILHIRIRRAVANGDKSDEMCNRYVLGGLLQRWGRFPDAIRELNHAASLAESLKQNWMANRIRASLARIAQARGMPRKASEILAARSSVPSTAADAPAMLMVARVETDPAERMNILEEALRAARTASPPSARREAMLLHEIALTCMATADYRCALERTKQAAVLYEKIGAKPRLLDLLRTQGTLHLEHGRYREAEEVYRRVWQAELQSGDRIGALRTQALLGVAVARIGRSEEAIELLDKAVADTIKLGVIPRTRPALVTAGTGYAEIGEHTRSIALFERMSQVARLQTMAAGHLTCSYLQVGRFRDAVDAGNKALAGRSSAPEEEQSRDSAALWCRAQAREKLGESEDALQDAIQALDALEQAQQRLIPTDFMKLGFSSRGKEIADFIVASAFRLKRYDVALNAAEQARGRAFLDLLASRGASDDSAQLMAEEWKRLNRFLSRRDETAVASDAYAKPISKDQMVETAKRLESTLLTYWVTPEAVYLWSLDREGKLRAASESIKEAELRALIDRVRKLSDTVDRPAWRRLYAVLIEPLRIHLPRTGALLTVIPHGPLFDLPFAALQRANGRYLIEDYRLHYASSASMLEFTRTTSQPDQRRYVVVADPAKPPNLPGGKPLPSLPAARKEARAIASALPSARILLGADAHLDKVRELASSASVLHFATHAVVQTERPLESFLALADGQRLAAAEIYEMQLPESLVVLSACRSAAGPISSDGVLGLTRAFFAAGASSVIASVWDVPDEPASQLMAEFYSQLRTSGRYSDALRSAQVKLMQHLRDGKLTVQTQGGPAVLPEHPLLWAGFELIGEK